MEHRFRALVLILILILPFIILYENVALSEKYCQGSICYICGFDFNILTAGIDARFPAQIWHRQRFLVAKIGLETGILYPQHQFGDEVKKMVLK